MNDCTRANHRGLKQLKLLENIALTIRKGELVALLGKSGNGKSTLLQQRFYAPEDGQGPFVVRDSLV